MTQVEGPIPTDWTEMVLPWTEMLPSWGHDPNEVIEWVRETTTGRWHLSGWKSTEGFSFRFEYLKDATRFALRWS